MEEDFFSTPFFSTHNETKELTQSRMRQLQEMPYEEYLKTSEWNEMRKRILERDGYRCRVCNTDEALHVHHRTYARRGHEDTNDLTTLCQVCHEDFHAKPRVADHIGTPEREFHRDEAKPRVTKAREEYLIWLLIQNPKLYSYVDGIMSENDFAETDTRALYQLFSSASSSDQTFEQLLPSSGLEGVVTRIKESIRDEFPLGELKQVRDVVKVSVQIKRALRSQRTLDMKDAADAGDKEGTRQLQQEIMILNETVRLLEKVLKRNA